MRHLKEKARLHAEHARWQVFGEDFASTKSSPRTDFLNHIRLITKPRLMTRFNDTYAPTQQPMYSLGPKPQKRKYPSSNNNYTTPKLPRLAEQFTTRNPTNPTIPIIWMNRGNYNKDPPQAGTDTICCTPPLTQEILRKRNEKHRISVAIEQEAGEMIAQIDA
jgi:hypothetical protein